MTEIAIRDSADIATPTGPTATVAPFPTRNQGAMRLVEWAEEAQAASHLARALCTTPFAGSWKGDHDGATAAILKGAEVGLTPVTALGAFDNIQGTPAPKAITLRALVQAHGHDLEIVEADDQHAVARYRRSGRGEWLTTSFTMDNARAMKLAAKDNWVKQPEAMLVARVTSKAARLVASDVILGIGYSAEEIRDEAAWDGSTAPPREVQGRSGADRMSAVLGAAQAGDSGGSQAETSVAEGRAGSIPAGNPPESSSPEGVTPSQIKKLGASMRDADLTDRAEALAYVAKIIGREVGSRNELTKDEASRVIDALERGEVPARSGATADPEAVWQQIVQLGAEKRGWDLAQVAHDFHDTLGLIPDEATIEQLRSYLHTLVTGEEPTA